MHLPDMYEEVVLPSKQIRNLKNATLSAHQVSKAEIHIYVAIRFA